MLHRRTHADLDVAGCYGCKIASINFATVPGGARDQRSGISGKNQYEKDLHRYREKRRAGEHPDGTTRQAMERYDRRVGSWEKREAWFRDDNSPEQFNSIKKKTLNER